MRIRPDLSWTAVQDDATTRCLAAPVASSQRSVIPACDTAADPKTAPDLASAPPKTRHGCRRSIAARRAPLRGDTGEISERTKTSRRSRRWRSEAAGTWCRHRFHLFGLISLFLSAPGECRALGCAVSGWPPGAGFGSVALRPRPRGGEASCASSNNSLLICILYLAGIYRLFSAFSFLARVNLAPPRSSGAFILRGADKPRLFSASFLLFLPSPSAQGRVGPGDSARPLFLPIIRVSAL